MRKIIFDNIVKGFPADENFLAAVDEQREALVQACRSLFGDEPTILSGLELIHRGQGQPTTTLNGGYVWFKGDVMPVEQQVLNGIVHSSSILFGVRDSGIEATYHSGETLPAYNNNEVYVVVNNNPGMSVALFTPLSAFRRVSIKEHKWRIVTSVAQNTSLSLTALLSANRLMLSGVVALPLHGCYNRWLSVATATVAGQQISVGQRQLFVAPVELVSSEASYILNNEYVAYAALNADNTLQVYVTGGSQEVLPTDLVATIYININTILQ